MALADQIAGVESGGDANATNPNSSAGGAGQFIDSTWTSLLRQHRPDLADGKSDSDLIALKGDPMLSKQMIDAYASDNGAILSKNGLPVTPGSTYLAHFAGPQGAVSVLKADPNTPVSQVLSPDAVKSNPFLAKMTAGDLAAWASRKMGDNPGTPAPQARPAVASGGILNLPGQTQAAAAPASPGILNAPDDTSALDAFRSRLADLASQQQQQQPAPQLAPISIAMPRGIPRAKLLAALNQPVGG
jgi:hypothetical protein